MITRRKFLKNTVMSAPLVIAGISNARANNPQLNKIGVQLFSLPKLLDKDFSAAIAMLAQMGYKEIEMFGPYSFSSAATQERWSKMAPVLGFKGSGFFGHTASEVKEILGRNGIAAPSLHTDLDTLENGMEKLGEAANTLGSKYVVLPAIPDERRKTLDDYKKIAAVFNKVGAAAKKAGIRFGYHNHGYGLQAMDGKIPLQLILEQTDPELVFFEMDVYWTAAGGADPIAYLTDYPDRYKMLHLKDMSKQMRFSGDGGESKQWIELFPYMTTAGSGVLNLKEIVAKARQTGVEHFFVEQDMVADPEVALKKSFDYLASL